MKGTGNTRRGKKSTEWIRSEAWAMIRDEALEGWEKTRYQASDKERDEEWDKAMRTMTAAREAWTSGVLLVWEQE